jgi:hypothetical protein
VTPGVRVDFLGVQEQRAGIGQKLLAQRPSPVDFADLG